MKHIQIGNGDIYQVLGVAEVNYSRVKRGTIDRHLKGDNDPTGWLLYYTDYWVTAKNENESYERTFIYTETEYKSIIYV